MERGNVSACFVQSVLTGVRARGLNPADVLRHAGIDEDCLRDDQIRVSISAYSRLLREIAQLLDDEMFGLDQRRMKVGSFAMLCYAVIHTPTLEKALGMIARYFGLMLDDVAVSLEQTDRTARLVLRQCSARGPRHVFLYEALLTFIHGLACWLVRRRIPLTRAEFSYPQPPYVTEYSLLYSSRLRFDQPVVAVWFNAALLALPVLQTRRTVKTFLAQAPENMLVKYKNTDSPVSRVRRLLRRSAPTEWPDLPSLAAHLAVPPSTLRRHLAQDGTSFQAIKDDLRRDLAVHWLAEDHRSVASVAGDLGFAEPSAFHRAFRRWTGGRPGALRREAQKD